MTVSFHKGRFGVRLAAGAADVAACQALRHRCFFGGAGVDADAFDARCDHVMIASARGLVATFRVMRVEDVTACYAAQSYDLSRLSGFADPMIELGRFCIADGAPVAEVTRLAWGALAGIVDTHKAGLIFGCSSFAGIDPAPYRQAFGVLGAQYQAPDALAPGRVSKTVVALGADAADRLAGLAQMPPLLRSYLGMGGWVSDHAVIDPVMRTLHVFTGLEIARIPPARAAALRALAGLDL